MDIDYCGCKPLRKLFLKPYSLKVEFLMLFTIWKAAERFISNSVKRDSEKIQHDLIIFEKKAASEHITA